MWYCNKGGDRREGWVGAAAAAAAATAVAPTRTAAANRTHLCGLAAAWGPLGGAKHGLQRRGEARAGQAVGLRRRGL